MELEERFEINIDVILLYSTEKYLASKSNELLPIQCKNCSKAFYVKQHRISRILNGKLPPYAHLFCSKLCERDSKARESMFITQCASCLKSFHKKTTSKNQTKSGRHFCTKSCAAVYNNTHKTHGTRRSKLERWIEQQLSNRFTFEIHYNKTSAIEAELDIFIPHLKLAFELNGIFHYRPIFSAEQFQKIQNNDIRKFQACLELGIELCVIDVSDQIYFNDTTSQKYLDMIITKMEATVGLEPTTGTLQKCCSAIELCGL